MILFLLTGILLTDKQLLILQQTVTVNSLEIKPILSTSTRLIHLRQPNYRQKRVLFKLPMIDVVFLFIKQM